MYYDTFGSQLLHAYFMLIVIMSPFTGLPVFLKITQNFDQKKKIGSMIRAITFSAGLLFFFLLFGSGILGLFGISFEGFKVAGGVVLLLLGVQYMFHMSFKEKRSEKYSTDIIVPFAMPLIIGPGVITTIILMVNWYSYLVAGIAGALALLTYLLFLYFSTHIQRVIGEQGIEVLARFMGLLLMAIAIDMMRSGIAGFIQTGLGG